MNTQHTPYEEEIRDIQSNPKYADIRGRLLDEVFAKRKGYGQGYRQAIADYAPLLAAAEAVLQAYREGYKDSHNLDIPVNIAKLEDAIKQAKEGAA